MNIIRTILLIQKNKVLNMVLSGKQLIQLNYKKLLTGRLTENYLKPYICKRIDVSRHIT